MTKYKAKKARTMSNNNYESAIDNTGVSAAFTTPKNNSHPEPLILKLFQLGFSIAGRLSPTLASRLAYKLWFTPTRFKTPASEQKALNSSVVEFHSIDNHDIATFSWEATDLTDAPIVLLVHGWSGRGTQLGAFVEPLTSAGYRVISFDAPAHGKSSGKQTNLYEVADVILGLQQHYGKFDSVITHSFGGPCTARAVQHGLKTDSIVSICPPATMFGLVEKFASALHLTKATSTSLVKLIETRFGKDIWQNICMENMVKNITTPGMVIHDAHDIDIPWEEGQTVAFAWNNAPFMITSGLGHRRILRDSAVIKAAVDFIQKLESTK